MKTTINPEMNLTSREIKLIAIEAATNRIGINTEQINSIIE